jgi:hypothetical protein
VPSTSGGGEVLVAYEDMNDRLLHSGGRSPITGEALDHLLLDIADVQDAYVDAWNACEAGTNEWRTAEGLEALDKALAQAAQFFHHVASRV